VTRQFVAEVELPQGRTVGVRAMTHDDVAAIAHLYSSLSAEDRYRRFFTAFHATEQAVGVWVHDAVNRGYGLVAVATSEPDEPIVGEAFYVVLPNGDGEFALTVHPGWRGWLGPYLLDLLAEAAHERGVPNLESDILGENRTMLCLIRHRGHVVLPASDFQIVRVAIGTGPEGPVWPARGARPRVLVEGGGVHWNGIDLLTAAFDVYTCPGPGPAGRRHCPALHGERCPLAAEADAVVVAFPPASERGAALLRAHTELHPEPGLLVDLGRASGGTLPTGLCRVAPEGNAAKVLSTLPALVAVRLEEGAEEAQEPALATAG
jgi:hypothetical protein